MSWLRRSEPEHPGALPLEGHAGLTDDYFELARFWVSAEQGRSFSIVGTMTHWPPELLGSLLVECVQTAAAGYSAHTGLPEAEVLQGIWRGFDEERARLVADGAEEN
ncbi:MULTISPECIES: hypothetical protein [Sphingomonas]|uniref:DUF5076 domain-containing protein n=1 Tax=Sphingomonas leidyi TaxID=68569 RepID=A0A7X5ZUA4_9SPHN|nr:MULTISPECIES: hypothetical protein [Sphingomonas]MBN8811871.1 hypothetical protein [Sphingomonas sp.]NIJ63494.1 hypothetical protein [Sphingomonas leidyi]OJY48466.1 MAG: hypothetical protein BGP17_01430 [Sphingomonas sp. 67-41]